MRLRTSDWPRPRLCVLAMAALAALAGPARADDDPLLAGFRTPPKAARPSAYWLWLNGYVNRDYVETELRQLRDAGISGVCIFDMGARGLQAGQPPAGPPFLSDRSVADIAHAVRVAGRLGLDVQLSAASSWDMGGSWVEPRHASMGLYRSEVVVEGPIEYDAELPLPAIPERAPRNPDGGPAFLREVAVLALPAGERMPGHDFVFALNPSGPLTLNHAVLTSTLSEAPDRYGPLHLFAKDFTLAVSTTEPTETAFREVLSGSLEPHPRPQRFDLPKVQARFVRLRILGGHNPRFDRVQLGEFELFDAVGINVVGSHEADRARDGAELLGQPQALGVDRDWTADNIHDGVRSGPAGSWSSSGPPPARVASAGAVIDLSDQLDAGGRLRWKVPPGRWLLTRYVCANTGERLKVPSPNSDGLATDHFSAEATGHFLDTLIGRLHDGLGDLAPTALRQIYLASYEVRGPIWTPDFLDRFRAYRGYTMTPYLPVLSGHVVGDEAISRRFLHDYRLTLGDLLTDAYYRAAVAKAHAAGLGIESEAGGPGPPIHRVPVDALEALGAIDEVRGEFWPHRPDADRLWVVKETASAAHIYGKPRVHMEAFTATHHWEDGPFDLKPSADRAFCEGMNHVVWHTSSHQPPESGEPGWVYNAGTHLTPKIAWWSMAPAFLDYLGRCSHLLQQGLFVADACYYYGNEGYNFVPPKHVDPSLGPGYDYDVTNAEVILTRMAVRDGRIVLPDGMSYAALVLPDRPDIDLDVLTRIEELVRDGATVVGPKPSRSSGLTGYPESDMRVRSLADRLWGDCDGRTVFEHAHGRGRIVWRRPLRAVLGDRGIGPDLRFEAPEGGVDLDFIHRRTDDADIYFLRNLTDRAGRATVTFRVRGKAPERWDAVSGEVRPLFDYQEGPQGISVPIPFDPYGSTFVVFRRRDAADGPIAVRPIGGDAGGESPGLCILNRDGARLRLRAESGGHYQLTTPDGRAAEVEVAGLPDPIELSGPWTVEFIDGRGAPPSAPFERLSSWTDREEKGIRHYSGLARYRIEFDLPADWLAAGRRVRLDLGDLWAVGAVSVNDRSLGVVWAPPFVVDITDAARPGRNALTIEVANTWSNRLVGDALSTGSERHTRTNITASGDRPWKDVALRKSGLFGPVRLHPAIEAVAELR